MFYVFYPVVLSHGLCPIIFLVRACHSAFGVEVAGSAAQVGLTRVIPY